MEKALSIAETRRILDVSPPVAYDLVKSGKLPAVRVGRQWRVTEGALREFLGGGGSQGKAQESREA